MPDNVPESRLIDILKLQLEHFKLTATLSVAITTLMVLSTGPFDINGFALVLPICLLFVSLFFSLAGLQFVTRALYSTNLDQRFIRRRSAWLQETASICILVGATVFLGFGGVLPDWGQLVVGIIGAIVVIVDLVRLIVVQLRLSPKHKEKSSTQDKGSLH